MLMPHEFGIITIEEAKKIVNFIDSKIGKNNYKVLHEAGMNEVFDKLKNLVEMEENWQIIQYMIRRENED